MLGVDGMCLVEIQAKSKEEVDLTVAPSPQKRTGRLGIASLLWDRLSGIDLCLNGINFLWRYGLRYLLLAIYSNFYIT